MADTLPALPEPDATTVGLGAVWNRHSMAAYATEAIKAASAAPAAPTGQPSAIVRFKESEAECDDLVRETPLERLRYFCSLSMNGQDWLDVEQFFDALASSPVAPTLRQVGMFSQGADGALTFHSGESDAQWLCQRLDAGVTGGPHTAFPAFAASGQAEAPVAGIPLEAGIAWQAGAFANERKAVTVEGHAWYRHDHPFASALQAQAPVQPEALTADQLERLARKDVGGIDLDWSMPENLGATAVQRAAFRRGYRAAEAAWAKINKEGA